MWLMCSRVSVITDGALDSPAVTLPISRSALDKLGKRLCAQPHEVAAQDWETLKAVLDVYQTALDDAQDILEKMDFAPTSRVKSTGTLVDKLRRGTSFKSVADVGGSRIVIEGGRRMQDEVVRQIETAFAASDPDRPPSIKDRRAEPSHGYRAVHVVVHHMGLPLEIQVRTGLQDVWAQIVERLGDTWGRELRYGEPIRDGDEPLVAGADVTKNEFMEQVMALGDAVSWLEEVGVQLGEHDIVQIPSGGEQATGTISFSEVERHLRQLLDNVSHILDQMEAAR